MAKNKHIITHSKLSISPAPILPYGGSIGGIITTSQLRYAYTQFAEIILALGSTSRVAYCTQICAKQDSL